jgi:hypothetical protein
MVLAEAGVLKASANSAEAQTGFCCEKENQNSF